MGISEKEALEKGYAWKLYNPFVCRGDIVAATVIICIIIFGMIKHTTLSLFINSILGLSVITVSLIDFLLADKIKVRDIKTRSKK